MVCAVHCVALCVSSIPSPPDRAIGGVGGELDFLIIRFHINLLIKVDRWRSNILRGWVCLGISIIATCMGSRDGKVINMRTCCLYSMLIIQHIPVDVVDC